MRPMVGWKQDWSKDRNLSGVEHFETTAIP